MELWTEKYKPRKLDEVIGNKSTIRRLFNWLKNWKSESKRAILLCGPPGIGKTTAAQLACRQLGYNVYEVNSSDKRSRKTLTETLRRVIDTKQFDGSFGVISKNAVIMDEVDGVSSGDRGGISILCELITKTAIPIICICNERTASIRNLARKCLVLNFKPVLDASKKLLDIFEGEKLTTGGVSLRGIRQLLYSFNGDLRKIINHLQFISNGATFNRNDLTNRSPAIITKTDIFTNIKKLFVRNVTLANKYEIFYSDYFMVPLFVHENAIRMCTAIDCRVIDTISDSDIIHQRIKGNQAWELLPYFGLLSTVLPTGYRRGEYCGSRISFPIGLGKSSVHRRLTGELKEVKTRLRVTTTDIFLVSNIFTKLITTQSDGVQSLVGIADDYKLQTPHLKTIFEINNHKIFNGISPQKAKTRELYRTVTKRHIQVKVVNRKRKRTASGSMSTGRLPSKIRPAPMNFRKVRVLPKSKLGQSRTPKRNPGQSRSLKKKPSQSRLPEKKLDQSRTLKKKPDQSRALKKKPRSIDFYFKKKPSQSRTLEKKPSQSRTLEKKSGQSRTLKKKPRSIDFYFKKIK